jgi:hypothetical protein
VIKDAILAAKDLDKKVVEILNDYKTQPHKAMADAQTLMAKFNPCLRARKCMLVPYENTTAGTGKGATSAIAQANHGNGCCPGQTGHHVMPGAIFYEAGCGYDDKAHEKAPTICLEGTKNAPEHGSHGAAHGALGESMKRHRAKHGNLISYNDAQDKGLDAIEAAGAKHCNRACLKAQLDAFYRQCNKGDRKNLTAASGMGGPQPIRPASAPTTPITGR